VQQLHHRPRLELLLEQDLGGDRAQRGILLGGRLL
jgi:hypothetical protein